MEVGIHEIIHYYGRANASFAGIFIEQRALSKGLVLSRRTNPYCGGIAIPLKGSARFSLNGTPYILEPGMVVHSGPDMKLDIEILDDKPWQMAVVHYILPDSEAKEFPLFKTHFSFPSEESAKIPDLIHGLLKIQATPGTPALFEAKRLFINLLGELFESLKKHLADGNTVYMDEVMEYIRQNYAEPLSITQIAACFRLDRRRLALLFKRHTGMTPSHYLMESRILKAKELLHACDCPINQVSEYVGYTDSLYFSKVFKKKIGLSPSEYREYLRNNL